MQHKFIMAVNSYNCNFSIFDCWKYGSDIIKMSCQSVLNSLRKDNLSKLYFAHLNINSKINLIVSKKKIMQMQPPEVFYKKSCY